MTLTPEQFVHEFAGQLSSVRQQCAHLLFAADLWRASGERGGVGDARIRAHGFPALPDLIADEAATRVRPEAELADVREYQTRLGPFHATYHRGQIAGLLKSHGVDFPDTDFILWLNPPPT